MPVNRLAKPCPIATLEALEAAHSAALSRRHQILHLRSAEAVAADWDAVLPLNRTQAWEAYTVWDVFAPTYGCLLPTAVGGLPGDGRSAWNVRKLPLEAKTLCNARRLRQRPGCTVYSFGTGWDVTFELAILNLAPHCTVRTFDPTVSNTTFWSLVRGQMPSSTADKSKGARRVQLHQLRRRLTFRTVGLGSASRGEWDGSHGLLWNGARSVSVASLASLMAAHGDTRIDVLKVDVEGAEHVALREAAAQGTLSRVGQLVVEVSHLARMAPRPLNHACFIISECVRARECVPRVPGAPCWMPRKLCNLPACRSR